MKCFELREDDIIDGLLIDEAEGSPRVNITDDGEFYLPLDADTSRYYLLEVDKLAPVRLEHLRITNDGHLTPYLRPDNMALMRVVVSAGHGGTVVITSGSYEELFVRNRVTKAYRQFPCMGVKVIGEHEVPEPWVVGAKKLELLITMVSGSCFRVHRTGQRRSLLENLFIEWTGSTLQRRPRKKGYESQDRRDEQVPKKTLMFPTVGLA